MQNTSLCSTTFHTGPQRTSFFSNCKTDGCSVHLGHQTCNAWSMLCNRGQKPPSSPFPRMLHIQLMTLSYVICTTKRSHWPACNSTMTGRLRSYVEACASSSHTTETKPSELSTDRSVRCTAFRGRQFFFLYRTSEWCLCTR